MARTRASQRVVVPAIEVTPVDDTEKLPELFDIKVSEEEIAENEDGLLDVPVSDISDQPVGIVESDKSVVEEQDEVYVTYTGTKSLDVNATQVIQIIIPRDGTGPEEMVAVTSGDYIQLSLLSKKRVTKEQAEWLLRHPVYKIET
jgi:hypothetical protein